MDNPPAVEKPETIELRFRLRLMLICAGRSAIDDGHQPSSLSGLRQHTPGSAPIRESDDRFSFRSSKRRFIEVDCFR
jgi:hypothetical protein